MIKGGSLSDTRVIKANLSESEAQVFLKRSGVIAEKGYIPYNSDEKVTMTNVSGKSYEEQLFNPNLYAAFLWAYTPFSAYSVIANYVDNNQIMLPQFYGASTDSMTSKNPTLSKMQMETFTRIIMGEDSVDAFDKFAENRKNLGGNDITNEVNEWDKTK